MDRLQSTKEIKAKIEKNRDLINVVVTSDKDPILKKILITQLSKNNERLIKQLK